MAEGVPDFVARAMLAQGKITPEEVAAVLDGDLIPTDDAAAEEERRIARGALVCCECGGTVDLHDRETLREIRGWDKARQDGGQNHVRFRQETGRFMCATCSLRRRHVGSAQQESLLG